MPALRPKGRQGFLVIVITLVALLLLISLQVVRYLSAHLGMTNRQEHQLLAQAAAAGGLAQALQEVCHNSSWHTGLPLTHQTNLSSYQLTFNPDLGLGYSLNNAGGSQALLGWQGRSVAPGNALLVAQGQSGPIKVQDCALVTVPQVLLQDEFTTLSGQWFQSNQQAPILLLGHYLLDLRNLIQISSQAGQQNWRDYRFRTRATVTSGVGLGLMVRVQGDVDHPSGYLAHYDALDEALQGGSFKIYAMQAGHPGPVQARITRQEAGLGGILGLAWLLNLQHTYDFTVQDNRLQLSVDDQPVLSWTDPNRRFMQGRVGIHPLLGAVLLVDSVRVDSLFRLKSRWRQRA